MKNTPQAILCLILANLVDHWYYKGLFILGALAYVGLDVYKWYKSKK